MTSTDTSMDDSYLLVDLEYNGQDEDGLFSGDYGSDEDSDDDDDAYDDDDYEKNGGKEGYRHWRLTEPSTSVIIVNDEPEVRPKDPEAQPKEAIQVEVSEEDSYDEEEDSDAEEPIFKRQKMDI